jgi:hypothetical protein
MSFFFNPEARERGLTFQPRPDDIIISPYSKCGTTLLQQIAHGLRTRGDMNFAEITEVTPWIEIAFDMGWDLEAEQVANPRLYKSHLSRHDIPKGARYIVSVRNSADAVVSSYRFFEGFTFEPGTISLEEYFDWRVVRHEVGMKGYWVHLASWLEQAHNEDVLLLCYEDVVADLPAAVRMVANFMRIPLDDELFEIVVRQASRDFMLAHRHQFDTHLEAARGLTRAGAPLPLNSDKVTPGNEHTHRLQLAPHLVKILDEIWREQITPKFGFETYEQMRQMIKEIHQSKAML